MKKSGAKKSLGQNFLRSKTALDKIVRAGDIKETDIIIEIGPGKGALTEKLLQTKAFVIAIEKDRELIPYLEEKFALEIKSKQLTLIEGDILDLSAHNILKTHKLQSLSYKLIANIPYYITGEIIRKFFEEEIQPEKMVLLVQKEVAERIVSRDKKESILSIACKVYSNPKYIGIVKREAFTPIPNVDSAIIAFNNISKTNFIENKISEKNFFKVMKLGFAHKRKKLSGNLKSIKDTLNQKEFEKIKDKRPEELSVKNWVDLITNTK